MVNEPENVIKMVIRILDWSHGDFKPEGQENSIHYNSVNCSFGGRELVLQCDIDVQEFLDGREVLATVKVTPRRKTQAPILTIIEAVEQ